MNELCFTTVVLIWTSFNHSFNKQKIINTSARKILCLDYSNLEERRNISKLYMIVRGHLFPVCGLGNECA